VEGGDEELSEEGLSWDELEKNALKEDRERIRKQEEEMGQQKPILKKRGKR
jgi:hypothetical protein